MKRQGKTVTFLKQKSYLLAVVLMLAAVFGMTGVYVSEQRSEKKQQEQLAQEEQELKERQEQLRAVQQAELKRKREQDAAAVDKILEAENNDMDAPDVISTADKEITPETPVDEETPEIPAKETAADPVRPELAFDPAQEMAWPMEGNVIMNFSMDQTIYFATLDQYKYNPALVIQGNVNDKVVSVADGKVSNIETSAVTGLTVTVDLGDGYSAVYGQLKEVPFNAGDYLNAGDTIGYISEPTKYYSVEGVNLYFQMIKDNVSIDPMAYLQ